MDQAWHKQAAVLQGLAGLLGGLKPLRVRHSLCRAFRRNIARGCRCGQGLHDSLTSGEAGVQAVAASAAMPTFAWSVRCTLQDTVLKLPGTADCLPMQGSKEGTQRHAFIPLCPSHACMDLLVTFPAPSSAGSPT